MRYFRFCTAFFTCCFPLLVVCTLEAANKQEGEQELPDPIMISRSGGKITIPEVARDEVICFCCYTTQDNILKMSAQLYPLQAGESREVTLQVKSGDGWKKIATSEADELGWLATFRIPEWDMTRAVTYQMTHPGGASYEGIIRRDPVDKEQIVVAAFTGNSNGDRTMRKDIVANIKKIDPDLLFFSGDQSYDHRAHTAAWLLFGRQFGEIIKDRPMVSIPDDHDVGQGNLWGEGGKKAKIPGAADGGYTMSAEYVNMVQRAQTSHLPDPYLDTKIEQDITVYYTSLNVGGIDFAILEDRKWKTGPAGLIPKQGPRPDHINNPSYDPSEVDVPEARLLGDRQLQFLRDWQTYWKGAEMKAVLSQTIFAGGAHIHGKANGRLLADLDSNGWPQSGRARALEEFRRCFAFHIAGDQHLATVIHHGINSWEDAGWSFCVPSIVNYYGRWWWPLEEALNHDPESPLTYTGRYYDGFRNKLTMQAYANPTGENYNAAGFGIVRFNKPQRTITMECWPRHIDVSAPDAKQFAGWPITINQLDNYGRKPQAYLPTIKVTNAKDAVITVKDDYLNRVVYSVRMKGDTFEPGVFREATYSIRLKTDDGKQGFLDGIASTPEQTDQVIEVTLK